MSAQVTELRGDRDGAQHPTREVDHRHITTVAEQRRTDTRDVAQLDQRDVGKVSGVAINQTGNMGGSSRIVIRGAGSILGENQPLFIVDGIPVSNAGFSTATASGGRDYGSAISTSIPTTSKR
jgi:outer membrane cobalamin receptor